NTTSPASRPPCRSMPPSCATENSAQEITIPASSSESCHRVTLSSLRDRFGYTSKPTGAQILDQTWPAIAVEGFAAWNRRAYTIRTGGPRIRPSILICVLQYQIIGSICPTPRHRIEAAFPVGAFVEMNCSLHEMPGLKM